MLQFPTRHKLQKSILLITATLLFASCEKGVVYNSYHRIPTEGWQADSLCLFRPEIMDTTASYDLYINIRNTGEYPMQNLWLFISEETPDTIILKDTIEVFLADYAGKWLGTGNGPVYNLPVLYRKNFRFDQKGTYTFEIEHAMRTDTLTGIRDIGLKLVFSK